MSIRSCSGTRYIVCGYRSTLPDIERQDMRTCCERVLFMHHPWMCTRPEIPERPGPAPVPVVSRSPQRQAGPCPPSAGHRAKRVRARWRRPVPGCSPASPRSGSSTASPWGNRHFPIRDNLKPHTFRIGRCRGACPPLAAWRRQRREHALSATGRAGPAEGPARPGRGRPPGRP